MSAPFGPKLTATAVAGDLFMITRGTGAALEVEKIDPTATATAALIAAGINSYLETTDWRGGSGSGGSGSGATILNGSGAPTSGTGADGDFYIRTATWTIYGPKASGAWGAPTSLIGIPGIDGTDGTDGADGANGSQLLSGAAAPGSGAGADGDFYFATGPRTLYGPKAAGAWGSGISLAGTDGTDGATVSLRKTTTALEWQHVGDADWTELVLLSALKGDPGADGSDGADGTDGANGANGAPLAGVNPQTGTSYTLVLADASKLVECANAGAITLTVPPNGSVAFPVGSVVHVAQAGAGQVTIAAAAGVTIKKPASLNARSFGQEAVLSLAKTDTNTWRLFGHLELA